MCTCGGSIPYLSALSPIAEINHNHLNNKQDNNESISFVGKVGGNGITTLSYVAFLFMSSKCAFISIYYFSLSHPHILYYFS